MDDQERGPGASECSTRGTADRKINVDTRYFPGVRDETWTFSFDLHADTFSLLTAIWGALRRAGVDVPAMTYGQRWVLFEPAGQRIIPQGPLVEGRTWSLEAAGLAPGAVLWLMTPGSLPSPGR